MPLKIAAKVDKVDRDYFEAVIEPLLDDPDIEFIGEISDAEKGEFLGDAAALLFPIDWPEPFGLAMIEAMANGTPVVAFRCGAVPEVVDDGVTGLSSTASMKRLPLSRASWNSDRGRSAARIREALRGRADGARLSGRL